MDFNGEIVFDIADDNCIEVDFETDILPTKIINKGDVIALGKKAHKFKWIYQMEYNNANEFIERLEKMLNQLCKRSEYVNKLVAKYDEVSISIYIRSEFAEIGYSLPSDILKKMSMLDCRFNVEIFSFGMVLDEEL